LERSHYAPASVAAGKAGATPSVRAARAAIVGFEVVRNVVPGVGYDYLMIRSGLSGSVARADRPEPYAAAVPRAIPHAHAAAALVRRADEESMRGAAGWLDRTRSSIPSWSMRAEGLQRSRSPHSRGLMRIVHALGLLAVLSSTVSAKDLIVRQRALTGFGASNVPMEETVYLSGDRITTDSDNARTIVDLEKKTITTADKRKQTYTTLTFDELTAQMEALRASIEQMPPETRNQLKPLFEEGEPVTVTPTGRTEKIAGHTAAEHALSGGPYSGAVWATTELETPPEFKRWKSIEQSRGGAARRLGEAMEKVKGFPLRTKLTVKTAGAPVELSNEVLEVREGSPPADVLKVPAGYAKQAAPSAAAPR
jgi:hypothetical protein